MICGFHDQRFIISDSWYAARAKGYGLVKVKVCARACGTAQDSNKTTPGLVQVLMLTKILVWSLLVLWMLNLLLDDDPVLWTLTEISSTIINDSATGMSSLGL
jgi:hypothetical protein